MFRPILWGLLVAVLCTAPVVGQGGPKGDGKKEAPVSHEVEIHFANGSNVRMTLLQSSIEVMTRYGKLTVPIKEIRRIDFGLHLPEGMGQKLDQALRNLGSNDFKLRDAALRDLIAMGPYAYPTLTRTVKNDNLEVAQRAQMALQRLGEKYSPKQLRMREEDLISTPVFTIVGRIISPGLKAKAEYFGELTLQVSALRTLRCLTDPGEAEVQVDAAKYATPQLSWLETDISVDPNSILVITASGQVDLWPQGPGQYVATPKGYSNAGRIGTQTPGALIGRVGEDGEPFVIGERYEGVPGREGRLYLRICQSPWGNTANGSYQVRITCGPSLR